MKPSKFLAVFFLILSYSAYDALAAEERMSDKAVMVLYVASVKIDNSIKDHENKSSFLTNTIQTELGKSSKYKLANPEFDNSVELAKNYNEACLSVEECARKEAKAVDADLVLISEITKLDEQCRITMRLENIYTKEILKNRNIRANCSIDDLESKTTELIYLIMRNEAVKNGGLRLARITSDPPGAKVTINNEFIGYTPIESKIATGQVRISMEFEGTDRYAPILVNELIEESNQQFIYNKVFAERNAYLIVNVSPTLSTVKIDDRLIDTSLTKRIPVEIRKEHSMNVSSKKYLSKEVSIPPLEPDQEYKIDINLEPNPCSIILTSNPNGADVIKNNEKVGTTPFNAQIKPGEYTYSIQKEFYESHDASFYCQPEEKIQRALVLKRAKYTELEKLQIESAAAWRVRSYYTFGIGVGLAAFSYSKYSEYKKYDDAYMIATDPFEIESLKSKRESSKSISTNMAIGSALTFGLSYMFYKLGEFPENLRQKTSLTILSQNESTKIVWQYLW